MFYRWTIGVTGKQGNFLCHYGVDVSFDQAQCQIFVFSSLTEDVKSSFKASFIALQEKLKWWDVVEDLFDTPPCPIFLCFDAVTWPTVLHFFGYTKLAYISFSCFFLFFFSFFSFINMTYIFYFFWYTKLTYTSFLWYTKMAFNYFFVLVHQSGRRGVNCIRSIHRLRIYIIATFKPSRRWRRLGRSRKQDNVKMTSFDDGTLSTNAQIWPNEI